MDTYFHVLTTINNDAMNMQVQISFRVSVFISFPEAVILFFEYIIYWHAFKLATQNSLVPHLHLTLWLSFHSKVSL